MEVSNVIMIVMAVFLTWSVIDKLILNNRFGYGSQFDEGLNAMGPMAAAMVGFMCLAPVLGKILTPIIAPVFALFHADSAMLSGTILAIDMGGYPLAQAMAQNSRMAVFAGGIYGAVMGPTITFTIPISLGILKKEDYPYLAKGVMAGVIAAPFACFAGGLLMGIAVPVLLCNLSFALLLSMVLAVGLRLIPNGMLKGFFVFSKVITFIMYSSLAAAIIEALTGFVLIKGMAPIGPQLEVVGIIGITLAGAYPFVKFITSAFAKPMQRFGKLLGINKTAVGGIVGCLANSLLLLSNVKDMDDKGKVIAIAFMVPAAFVFGDHLAYASTNIPEYLPSMIAAKLIGGVLAAAIAMLMLRNQYKKQKTV
jgi:ethanolamine transporter